MKVLLTGGTGFVGTELRKALRNEGHEVRLLVRPHSTGSAAIGGDYEIAYGDVLDTNACLRACEDCEAVVHLVGIIREYVSRGITFDELHSTATRNLVEAATRQGVKRFVHMSALGVREGAASRYHKTKLAAEEMVKASPLRWTIFRPSVIFGRGDDFIWTLVRMVKGRIVPLINGGRALMQPVAVSDVCRCMSSSLTMPATQGCTYELGGPERLSFRRMIDLVSSQLGLNIRKISIASPLARPVVRIMERFPSFPVTTDQLSMLLEDNVCETATFEKTFRIRAESFVCSLPSLLSGLSRERASRGNKV